MEISGAHLLVMFGAMVFGEVVAEVVFAGLPMDSKLALADAIADPVEAHVDGLGAALFDGVIEDARGTGIVDLDGCDRLWPAHFAEHRADGTCFLGIVDTGTDFCFCG